MALSKFVATWAFVIVLGISAVHCHDVSHEGSRRLGQHGEKKHEEPEKDSTYELQFGVVSARLIVTIVAVLIITS